MERVLYQYGACRCIPILHLRVGEDGNHLIYDKRTGEVHFDVNKARTLRFIRKHKHLNDCFVLDHSSTFRDLENGVYLLKEIDGEWAIASYSIEYEGFDGMYNTEKHLPWNA